ncbi:Putative Holin-X, holin superfamily III [Prevotella sp. tc2-28]|nr:phage holin family protein [Prevotella sp. tc2-28]SEA08558.1 Putative Holin-X, holin superfamily III [Prevotella sp. tc2-28]
MFSSDKNVESIAQLIEVLKDYMGLQKEYLKLDVIEKVVRLVTALILAFVLVVLGIAVMFYLSLAVAYWLTPVIGTGWAFFFIAMVFFLLLLLVFSFRKSWIERPLVRFLANILMN